MTPAKTIPFPIPVRIQFGIGLSVLLGHKRCFREDALKLTARLNPPVQVTGEDNIPRQGNYIITTNHYTRPGLNAWWIAIAINAAISAAVSAANDPGAVQDICWIMTDAWVVDGKWYSAELHGITKWAFSRLAKTYGFFTTPPVPGRPGDEVERAESVRKILTRARDNRLPVIGYVPEGRDFADSRLGWPPHGSGRFVSYLNRMGYRILPVGLYEEGGKLQVRFGEPYDLGEPHSHSSGEVNPVTFRLLTQQQTDILLIRTVMRRIAILLPENLRGEFG